MFHHPPYRLFILGAGFSKPAGLPLSIELLEHVRREVRHYFRYFGQWDGTLEKEIKEWKNLYPYEEVDLERVLAYSHRKHYLRLIGSDEYYSDGSRTIVAARKSIQRILIGRTPAVTPDLYLEFSSHLIPSDTILTFNYDTLLEQSLDDIDKPYSLTPEWWLEAEGAEFTHVDLLKMHGSVDWYDREYYQRTRAYFRQSAAEVPDTDPLFGPNPSVPSESLSKGKTHDAYGQNILKRVFRVPDYRKHFPFGDEGSSRVVPFILPLSYDKLLGHEPVLDLWENLHRIQRDFSSINFIGYSMPKHDSHAYEALGHVCVEYQLNAKQNHWERKRTPIQIITLADSDIKALEELPFLDPSKTRVWNQGFSKESLEWLDWGEDD